MQTCWNVDLLMWTGGLCVRAAVLGMLFASGLSLDSNATHCTSLLVSMDELYHLLEVLTGPSPCPPSS